ncbi:MAG: hypothetical protein Q9P90_01115 [candidate division KSB1 bacterium]|nr:hypothetical protein [candidate division KSB1 bacterium]
MTKHAATSIRATIRRGTFRLSGALPSLPPEAGTTILNIEIVATAASLPFLVNFQSPTRYREERSDDAISFLYTKRSPSASSRTGAPALRRLLAMTGKISSNGNN